MRGGGWSKEGHGHVICRGLSGWQSCVDDLQETCCARGQSGRRKLLNSMN